MRIPAWAVLILLLLLTPFIARWSRGGLYFARGQALLDGVLAPWILGLACALTIGYVWGGLDPAPVYHDEAAYVLQAQLFAKGLAAGAPAQLPQFFEQFHVLVSPVLAPKYPPGFALTLVPGIWLGVPVLIPLILTGVTGACLFLLARQIAGAPVALLATVIWTLAPANILLHAGYFSQTLTAALWLVGWWALLSWRERRRTTHLVLLGVVVGWLAISRPFTALLYALPLGVVVLKDVVVHRLWRGFTSAVAAGSAILLLLPIHNRLVTGHWLEMPYSRYTRTHLPFDRMGFGLRGSEPPIPLPPDMVAFTEDYKALHGAYTADRLPATVVARSTSLLSGLSGGAPALFGVLILLGLFRAPAAVLFASLTAVMLFIGHLAYAHPPGWLPYYDESFPVLALLAALGISRLIHGTLTLASSAESRPTVSARMSPVLLIATLGLLLVMPRRLSLGHLIVRNTAYGQTWFRNLVRALPTRSIVFVRYGPSHDVNYSLIANPPDYPSAPAWIVYDRGDDNARLMALAPDRVPYLYLEDEHRLVPLGTAAGRD